MKYLDQQEKELIKSIENGNWKPAINSKELIQKYSKIAADTIRKLTPKNI